MSTTSIDETLFSSHPSTLPATPEAVYNTPEIDSPSEPEPEIKSPSVDKPEISYGEEDNDVATIPSTPEPEMYVDDYGNTSPKPKSKTYTEEEVNERINRAVRERFARLERNQTPQQAESIQQAAENFEYNPNENESWQVQLESFVEQTLHKMSQKQVQQQRVQKEQQKQIEFEQKFHQGMNKFNDFVDIVGAHPITDAMTIATRAMSDPAAFLYAAAKQQPAELQRIAAIQDEAVQMVEMGRLEERMRKTRSVTNAPKPVSQSKGDMSMPTQNQKSKEPTIEELISQDEARKRARIQARRR